MLFRHSFALAVTSLPLLSVHLAAEEEKTSTRNANTIVLDEAGVLNLRIETVEAEESDFEETVFALGRIEILPGNKGIVSSRIAGRAYSVLALPDQEVDEGEELLWVESRQPGNPPPTIMLAAPISGLVTRVDIAVGQPIEPHLALIEIADLAVVEASARVPEHLAGRLARDQTAHIRLPGFPGRVFEAKLAHLGAYVDETSGTVEASFHVPNPDKELRPGMRAEFNIVVSHREGVTSVPRSAILGGPSQRFVYVKDFDLPNAFVKSPVVVGEMNDRFAEIISGLLPADEVVTRGAYSLSFAGAGSISLKEALDAAHGHEHAADGSELTPEKKASLEAARKEEAGGHEHSHGGDQEREGVSPLWRIATLVLSLLLLVSGWMNKRRMPEEEPPAPKNDSRKEAV